MLQHRRDAPPALDGHRPLERGSTPSQLSRVISASTTSQLLMWPKCRYGDSWLVTSDSTALCVSAYGARRCLQERAEASPCAAVANRRGSPECRRGGRSAGSAGLACPISARRFGEGHRPDDLCGNRGSRPTDRALPTGPLRGESGTTRAVFAADSVGTTPRSRTPARALASAAAVGIHRLGADLDARGRRFGDAVDDEGGVVVRNHGCRLRRRATIQQRRRDARASRRRESRSLPAGGTRPGCRRCHRGRTGGTDRLPMDGQTERLEHQQRLGKLVRPLDSALEGKVGGAAPVRSHPVKNPPPPCQLAPWFNWRMRWAGTTLVGCCKRGSWRRSLNGCS